MRKLPQFVRERLKASPAVAAHPEANILTGFAERSLSEPERAGVLVHLASCADCREILALALSPIDTEIVAPASTAASRSWFTWPAFRWGFATAGVALVVLGLVQFEHRRSDTSAMLARQAAPAPMAAALQKEVAPAPSLPSNQNTPAKATPAKKDTDTIAEAKPLLSPPATEPHRPSGERAEPSQTLAVAKLQTRKAPVALPESPMPGMQAEGPIAAQTANSQLAQSASAKNSAEQFFGDNSGPLSRAKPADIEPSQAAAASAVLATPRWTITIVGGLQRSLDLGKTWQDINVNASAVPVASGAASGVGGPIKSAKVKPDVMHRAMAGKVPTTPIFFRAVTAAGNEVWAGGSNAALFHSADGGNHWARVLPSSSGALLTGDVLSVEFSDPQHGTVTTSTPEIWTTGDGGQTWQKQ